MVVKDIIEEFRYYSPNTKVFLRNSDYPNAKDVPADVIIAKQYPEGKSSQAFALVIAGSLSAVPDAKDNVQELDGGRVIGDEYRLCYIDDGVMYFTDDFENCWGDDWKSAPLQDSAGEPYIYDDNRSAKDNAERGASRLVLIGFRSDWQTTYPWENENYSVEDVNKGAVAWICHDEAGGLFAGTPLSKAVGWIKRAGFLWGRLTI